MEKSKILRIFEILFQTFGPQHWWPGETSLEIMVGAVLTQNTAWKNVEKAIDNLKSRGLLDLEMLVKLDVSKLSEIIRPSGFYRLKASRLKSLLQFVFEEGGVEKLRKMEPKSLREKLLKIKGIGKETADSILLYALDMPSFVVDAYTRRILKRVGLVKRENLPYDEIQNLFLRELPADIRIYNEYHALLVKLGKEYCLKNRPRCKDCPIRELCEFGERGNGGARH